MFCRMALLFSGSHLATRCRGRLKLVLRLEGSGQMPAANRQQSSVRFMWCWACHGRLPPRSKPALLIQSICTGPPQVGFVFDPYEAAWDQSFEELCLYAKANGGVAHVPRRDQETWALSSWCKEQARPPSACQLMESGRHCT